VTIATPAESVPSLSSPMPKPIPSAPSGLAAKLRLKSTAMRKLSFGLK
jgi:hypothetical protein